ncbi:MAG: hypothetical protein SO444_04245, partial [Candidatus Onthomorpha sp.]|nr:hypothetical protein [Candidatus Onthomorpha sp.]
IFVKRSLKNPKCRSGSRQVYVWCVRLLLKWFSAQAWDLPRVKQKARSAPLGLTSLDFIVPRLRLDCCYFLG